MGFRIGLLIVLAVGINVAAYMAKNDHIFAANIEPLQLTVMAMEMDGGLRHFHVTGDDARWVLQQADEAQGEGIIPLGPQDILGLADEAQFDLISQEAQKAVYTFACPPVQLGKIALTQPHTGRMVIDTQSLAVLTIELTPTAGANVARR